MKTELTTKQRALLNFIDEHQRLYKVIPSLVELASAMGVSIAAIQAKIGALTRKKVLERKNIYLIKR